MGSTWRAVVLAVAVSFALAALALFVIFRYMLPDSGQDSGGDPLYVISSWEGQVAVFEGGQAFPKQVFDVYVSTLPPEEQQKLRKGIPVEDEASLSVLLEDYAG